MVAQQELRRRLPDADFIWFGPVGHSESDHWPEVVRLGPASQARRAYLSDRLDALVVGGGDLIHTRASMLARLYGLTPLDLPVEAWYPWLTQGLPGRPTIWNAVGVPEQMADVGDPATIKYAAVRGEVSRRNASPFLSDAAVVPDTALLTPRLLPPERTKTIAEELRKDRLLPEGGYLAVQAHRGIATDLLDSVSFGKLLADHALVAIQLGPCHGDSVFQELLASIEGTTIAAPPLSLEAAISIIAAAEGFVGSSAWSDHRGGIWRAVCIDQR